MMRIFKPAATAVLLIAIAGCGKVPPQNTGVRAQPVIQGEVTVASYDKAVTETLEHAMSVINSKAPAEQELDGDVGKIAALLALAQEKKVDEARTHEAALLSTEGSLYAVKGSIYKNNPRTAGELIATSFRYLDKAISLHPQDLNARINRGIVSSKIPEFLGKTATAHDDLEFVRDNADFARLSPELQDTIKALLAEVDSRLAKADRVQ